MVNYGSVEKPTFDHECFNLCSYMPLHVTYILCLIVIMLTILMHMHTMRENYSTEVIWNDLEVTC